jgi:hypothetical protein
LSEDAFAGMGRQGGVGLFRRGYQFGTDAQTLIDVPIQVWSMKGFHARWHGQAAAIVSGDLKAIGTERLKGSITNRLNIPLEDCLLAFGRKMYPLGDLPVNGSVVVDARTPVELKGDLTRRAAGYLASSQAIWTQGRGGQTPAVDPYDLLLSMMFHGRLPEGNQYATNDYFDELDLTEHLDYQRAFLVTRVSTAGSKLFLNDQEVTENLNASSFLRVLLPVTPGAVELEPPRDLR